MDMFLVHYIASAAQAELDARVSLLTCITLTFQCAVRKSVRCLSMKLQLEL